MTENVPNPIPVEPPPLEKKKHRNSFFWPVVLIVVGIVLFIQNLNVGMHLNWWAVFIYIPVVTSLTGAFQDLRRDGKFSEAVAGNLGSAVMVGTIATMLLLGVDWARWWPLTILAAGASMFINGLPSLFSQDGRALTGLVNWSMWVGIAGMLLGLGFLAIQLPIPSIHPYVTGYRWWAIPILVAGAGGLLSALTLSIRMKGKMGWAGWGLVVAGVTTLAVGVIAYYNGNWNILLPVILIAAGIIVMSGVLKRN